MKPQRSFGRVALFPDTLDQATVILGARGLPLRDGRWTADNALTVIANGLGLILNCVVARRLLLSGTLLL